LWTRRTEEAFAQGVDPNAILNDPQAPVSGNPKGDLTIVPAVHRGLRET
jgi:hypothetical protein